MFTRQIFAIFAIFCQFYKIKLSEKSTSKQFKKLNPRDFFCFFFFVSFFRISKTFTFTLGYLWINNGHVKNILHDIKKYRQRQRKKNVNLFTISAPFDLLLQVFYIQIILFEILKILRKSSMTHILLAEKQTTKKWKYIKHW